MKSNESSRPNTKQTEPTVERTASPLPSVYEPPRIVTHSAETLARADLRVNACTSYIP
jgi:hypothetical protein